MPWKILLACCLTVFLVACNGSNESDIVDTVPDPDVSPTFRANPTIVLTTRGLANNDDTGYNTRSRIEDIAQDDIVGGDHGGVTQHSGHPVGAVDFSASATSATLYLPDIGTVTEGVEAGDDGIADPSSANPALAIPVANALIEFNSANPEADIVYVQMASDVPFAVGEDNVTDYLSYGVWIYDPAADNTSSEVGAFVDASSGVVFMGTAIERLTGDVVYKGQVHGTYVNGATSQTGSSFAAFATLTASFAGADTAGTITGTFRNFSWGNPATVPQNIEDSLEINLGSANLSAEGEGLFTGATNEPSRLVGVYGGKFYYDKEAWHSKTNYPGIVAGTFSSSNSAHALLGVFFAETEDPPTFIEGVIDALLSLVGL